MPPIPLSNQPSVFTLVSENIFTLVSQYRWRLNSNGYAVTNNAQPQLFDTGIICAE